MPKEKKAKRPKSVLTDREVAKKAREYKKLAAREAKSKKDKQAIGKEICVEFDARGTHLLENDGVRVTDTIQRWTVYDFHGICQELIERHGRKEARRIIRKFQKQEVDVTRISQLVQAGEIDVDIVTNNSHEVIHARYPSVSFPQA